MKKKHIKLFSALLVMTMLFGLLVPVFAEGEDPEVGEPEPVVQSININANYYAGDSANTYSIFFTVMEELPAFTSLTLKIRLSNATVDQAAFESDILTGGIADVVRGVDYAIYPLTYPEAKGIPAKTRLCTLTVTSEVPPSAENLFISDFAIVKENESEPTAFTANVTVAQGPIVPELNEKTQAVYEALCALPNPTTLSFYQEDGSFTNLIAIQEKTAAATEAYNGLPSAYRTKLDTVMEFYDKTNYTTGSLATMLQGMLDARGLIEIAKATESITTENALSYQFLIPVFESKKNISLENILPDSTAYNEISQALSTLEPAATSVSSAVALANAEADGGAKTKTYACQTQLTTILSLGGHKYHDDYLAALETQITALKPEIETAYASEPIWKKALLDTLAEVKSNIGLVKEGIQDMPTMTVDGINRGSRYTMTFNRKTTLAETLAVTVSVVVTDKTGAVIDTTEKVFPANALSLDIYLSSNNGKYIKDEIYTITAYYEVNGGKHLIDTQDVTCYYRRTEEIGGLGTGTGTGLGLGGTTTGTTTPTGPTTGGTIFPDSNDEPETPTAPETTFHDLKNYSWATEAIDALYEARIINGMEEGIFNPAGQVTREQFCKMVVALFDIPTGAVTSAFGDVKTDAWYAPYITAAMQAGYVQGQSNEYFGIGESIMRQDMAVILYRALGDQNSKAILNFSDKENIAPYAEDAIAELVGLGIINGYEDGSFQPRGTATRAEAAKMIYGIYQYLDKI